MRRKLDNTGDAIGESQDIMVRREETGQALLACLLAHGNSEAADRTKRLLECEWDQVIRESLRQGVLPLLYQRLGNASIRSLVPNRVIQTLRELAVHSSVKSLRVRRELGETLRALRAEGIPVIVLKGGYLASIVYGDHAARPMRDLDLLVMRRDLERAEAALLELGYSRHPNKEGDYSECEHLQPLIGRHGVPIEIHWTIASPTEPIHIDVNGLWERAQAARIADVDVNALAPEDLLLHLCVHTSLTHQLELGLRACWDILEVARHFGEAIDWEHVRQRASEWRVEKYVYMTLRLAAELLGASIPDRVLTTLEPTGFKAELITMARREVLLGQAAPSVSPRFAEMCGRGRLRERAHLVCDTLLPSRTALRKLYPACVDRKWICIFYVLRWRDLLRKYGRALWRVVCRDEQVMSLVRWEHERARLMDWLKCVSA
jgi:Uncharacterised nucleotidyltransferase